MTIDESRRVIEEVYRYTAPRSRPGQIAAVANNSDLRLWAQAEPSTLLAVEHALAANEIMRNNILYGGIDVADPYMSYRFRLGVSERPLSNMAPAAAVAEMPPPIKKPERDEILRREPVRADDMPADVDAMQAELAMDAERLLGYTVMRTRLKLQDPLLTALRQLEIEPFDETSVKQYKNEMLIYAQNEARRMDAAEGVDPHSFNARMASWQTHSLAGYGKPVPEFALDKALQIKRACPEAEFEIEELTIVPDPFLIVKLGRKRRYIEVWDEPQFEAKNLSL